MEITNLPINIRSYRPESDEDFIYACWIREFKLSPFARKIRNSIYFYNQHKIIDTLINKSKIIVACNIDDENHIYGYVVFENIKPPVLHWLYVKMSYRGMGIENLLLQCLPLQDQKCYFSHFCADWFDYLPKDKVDYNPYLAFKGNGHEI